MTPLCHRCEHRAVALETGHGPRYECTAPGAVESCYMYQPVKPLAIEANADEDRPIGIGWGFAGRAHAAKVQHKLKLHARMSRDGRLIKWWEPE